MATKSLPLLPSRSEVYSFSLELRLALWIALNNRMLQKWTGICCQARLSAWISISSAKNLLPLLLDPNCHIVRKSRLDSQMINDHIKILWGERPVWIFQSWLNCQLNAAMSELHQVQQMDQPPEPCLNLESMESCEIISHCCFKQLKYFSVARDNETSYDSLFQQSKIGPKQYYSHTRLIWILTVYVELIFKI